MHGRPGPGRNHLTCLIFLMPLLLLGCVRVDAQDDSQGEVGTFAWRDGPNDVVLKVSRQSGMTRGRLMFTLHGSGELLMERYDGNYSKILEERTLWLLEDEVRNLLQGAVASRLPEWTGERLEESPVKEQIRRVSDFPYLRIEIALSYYPPQGTAVSEAITFPIEAQRSTTPIFETFPEIVAAWELESALKQLWEDAGE